MSLPYGGLAALVLLALCGTPAGAAAPSPALPAVAGPRPDELAAILARQAQWRKTLEGWHQADRLALRQAPLPPEVKEARLRSLEMEQQVELQRVREAQAAQIRGLYVPLRLPAYPSEQVLRFLQPLERQQLDQERRRAYRLLAQTLEDREAPPEARRDTLTRICRAYGRTHAALVEAALSRVRGRIAWSLASRHSTPRPSRPPHRSAPRQP